MVLSELLENLFQLFFVLNHISPIQVAIATKDYPSTPLRMTSHWEFWMTSRWARSHAQC